MQQLTDNPAVLHEAISGLNDKRNPEGYAGKTRITEYMATDKTGGTATSQRITFSVE